MEKKTTEIVKKTDKAVKTTESWWSFGTAVWEARGFFAPVTLLGGAMTAAIAQVFELISQFGWGAWVLAGVPAFIVAALIWWALAWLWHYRPGNSSPTSSKEAATEPFEISQETSLISEREKAIMGTVRIAMERIDKIEKDAPEKFDKIGSSIDKLTKEISSVRTSAYEANNKSDAALTIMKDDRHDFREYKAKTESILKWRWAYDAFCQRQSRLKAITLNMNQIMEKPKSDRDWKAWNAYYSEWSALFEANANVIALAADTDFKDFYPSESDFANAEWANSESDFPDSKQCHKYRKFRFMMLTHENDFLQAEASIRQLCN